MTKIEIKLLNSEEIAWTEDCEVEDVNDFFMDVFANKTAITVSPKDEPASVIPVSSIVRINVYEEKNESN